MNTRGAVQVPPMHCDDYRPDHGSVARTGGGACTPQSQPIVYGRDAKSSILDGRLI